MRKLHPGELCEHLGPPLVGGLCVESTSQPVLGAVHIERIDQRAEPVVAGSVGLMSHVRKGQYAAAVRLIVARCEATYTGRLSAYLPESTRLLLLKADGSVLVDADAGGYKPLN